MRIEEIRFLPRAFHPEEGLGLYVPGPYWVYQCTVLEAWDQVEAALPTLSRRADFTTKMLWEEKVWNSFPFGKRLALGRCIRYFADRLMLPYLLLNPERKSGTKKYLRT